MNTRTAIRALVTGAAAGGLRVDAQSLAAFNGALPERTRVRVKGRRLVLSSQRGSLMLIR